MSEFRAALQALVDATERCERSYLEADERRVQAALAVAKALLARPEQQSWTCFHCGEVFTDIEPAREHFGNWQTRDPECAIDIAEYHRMEEVSMRHLQEDTELHRALIAKECEMHRAVRRSEEEGYERGLRDAKLLARPEPVNRTPKLRSEPPTIARPLSEWNEAHGFVTWWKFPIEEPSWIGSPNDSDWPGYHTHWTPHPVLPSPPAASDGEKA